MFPHRKKTGMGEHKMPKNMFPTYTKRHFFEQSDILHAYGIHCIALVNKRLTEVHIMEQETFDE